MNPTPQPVVDIKHITQRVIDYYYSYGNVQQLSTKSIPSIPDIVNMVPAFYREAYNFHGGTNFYGNTSTMLEVLCTLDACQQKKYMNDFYFNYIIDRINSWNLPPTDNAHETRFYIYSSSKFGGNQDPESRRQFNPMAGLGLRDNQIQIPRRMSQARNYERDIQETLNDSMERGTICYKNDMSILLGRKNY
jgi:hypothetical protein